MEFQCLVPPWILPNSKKEALQNVVWEMCSPDKGCIWIGEPEIDN